mgnify:FL=1
MKLMDILKTVGGGLISTMVPGGPAIVSMLNEVLPGDKQLPETATGAQAQAAISKLPPTEQAAVMSKEYDVDITQIKQSNETLRTMLESDAANPQSTRPYIAKHSFHVLALVTLTVIAAWAYGVFTAKAEIVKAVMGGWPFVLAVVAPFVALLRAYFGMLKAEHKNKLDAAAGAPQPSGLSAVVSSLFKR